MQLTYFAFLACTADESQKFERLFKHSYTSWKCLASTTACNLFSPKVVRVRVGMFFFSFETKFVSFKMANTQVNGNNNSNNKLYLHDYNKVLQYCKAT